MATASALRLNSLPTTVKRKIRDTGGVVWDVLAMGLKGDGVTVDSDALDALLALVQDGDVILFPRPSARYVFNRAHVCNKRVLIKITSPETELHWTNIDGTWLEFTVNGSRIQGGGGWLTGVNHANPDSHATSRAIYPHGADRDHYLDRFSISDLNVDNVGFYGLVMQYVRNWRLDKFAASNVGYAGVMGLSVEDGTIDGLFVDTVTCLTNTNGYGWALTQGGFTSLEVGEPAVTADPPSRRIKVHNAHVKNVASWEAGDTHGGQDIEISNFTSYGCHVALMIGTAPLITPNVYQVGHRDNPAYIVSAGQNGIPQNIRYRGGRHIWGGTPGMAGAGIYVTGTSGNSLGVGGPSTAPASQPATEVPFAYAAGCSIQDVVLDGYGSKDSPYMAAIVCYSTYGLQLNNISLLRPSPHGINFEAGNIKAVATNISATDPWTDNGSVGWGTAIMIHSSYNDVHLANISLIKDTSPNGLSVLHPSWYVATHGIYDYASSTTGTAVSLGANALIDAATPVIDINNTITNRAFGPSISNAPSGASLLHQYQSSGTVKAVINKGGGASFGYPADQLANAAGVATSGILYSGVGVGVGVSPSYPLHIVAAKAADFLAKLQQTDATGYGLYLIPGADANVALRIANAANGANRHEFFGSGNASLAQGAGAVGLGGISGPSASALLHVYQAAINGMLVQSTNSNTGVAATQYLARSKAGGYGAGMSLQSQETGANNWVTMAAIEAEGENAFNNLSTVAAFLRFSTQLNNVLTERLRLTSGGNALFNSGGAGGGQGVIGLKDATTLPTSNPSGGGVLYSDSGALKWRGSSGTVTQLAAA